MRYLLLSLIAFSFLLSACSPSSKLVGSTKVTDAPPKSFEKIGIVAMVASTSTRAAIEMAMFDDLKSREIGATPTLAIFPLAGNAELIEKMELSSEELQEKIQTKVDKNNIDALMIISLLDSETTERYVAGSSYSVATMHPTSMYPIYNYNMYDYYGYAYNTVYEPGYTTSSTSYFLEINLYDITSGGLIWTGQSKTTDPDDLEYEAQMFAKMISQELLDKGVLKGADK